MIRFFAAHPTAANILMFIILLLGIAALPGLNKETFPEIDQYQVQVRVSYPGASAGVVGWATGSMMTAAGNQPLSRK